jgi:ribose/xylose/arabinose/galactoside ABC-type transport system permease subunit/ABC-type sugar transport system substrate-binding protein
VAINRRTALGLLTAAALAPAVAQSGRRRTIALLFDSLISPFWLAAIEKLRARIAANGWVSLESVSNMDDNRQYTQVQSMIERQVDGIVIVHTDDKAVIPAIRLANAAKVPMVHFNRAPARSDAYSVAVVADNRKLMDTTVTELLNLARQQGGHYRAAILLGDLKDANGVNRRDGAFDALGRAGDVVEVVAKIATEWNADKAFAGLSNALQAHPDVNLLITSSDFMTPQIEQALRTAGKWHPAGTDGHVLIAGFDGDENGYRELAAGYFDVDGVQDLDREVDLTIQALEQMWAGKRPPEVLLDPGFVVTRSTLGELRGRMWGYEAWKAKQETNSADVSAASGAAPSSSSAARAPGMPAAGAGVGSSVLANASWALLAAVALGFAHALFSTATLHDVMLEMMPLSILVAGQLLVLLLGQIDLSMTAVMALGSILSASLMTRPGWSSSGSIATLVGIGSCVAVGGAVGIFNGVCSAVLRIPSFIVTLSVMMAGGGAAVWYAATVSDTVSIGGLPDAFRQIGYGSVAHIPFALIMSVAVLGVTYYLLTRTVTGRQLYAIGHNAVAARISGVPVAGVTVAAFTASGVCAGLASIIYTSRLETGLPTLGQNQLLDIVGAAVIGGVSLSGGRGNVRMVLVGVAFLCGLDKALQLLGWSLFIVLAIKGCAILAAAVWDIVRQRRARGMTFRP